MRLLSAHSGPWTSAQQKAATSPRMTNAAHRTNVSLGDIRQKAVESKYSSFKVWWHRFSHERLFRQSAASDQKKPLLSTRYRAVDALDFQSLGLKFPRSGWPLQLLHRLYLMLPRRLLSSNSTVCHYRRER